MSQFCEIPTLQATKKLSHRLFDRELVALRLKKNIKKEVNFIAELVNDDLLERLSIISRSFKKAAIITPDIKTSLKSAHSANGEFKFEQIFTLIKKDKTYSPNSENIEFTNKNYDLIVSLLDLQIINNVEQYLQNIRSHLAPDGLMLLAAIGGNSLNELRHAWLSAESEIYNNANARIIPFIDVKSAGTLLQHCGFNLPVSDIDSHIVRYSSPLALMQELRTLSASNPLFEKAKKPVTKKLLFKACEKYSEIASDKDKKVRATLEILWLSGWAHHDSQQKPLMPGSAKVSLTKVLSEKN